MAIGAGCVMGIAAMAVCAAKRDGRLHVTRIASHEDGHHD
jgi:hypothetical protein